MLIRSKDKLKIVNLQNVDTIAVSKSDDFERKSYSVYSFNGADNVTTLGTYSTEEKAIKVLDMICEDYKCPDFQNCIGENEVAIYKHIVFQMPQDSEV